VRLENCCISRDQVPPLLVDDVRQIEVVDPAFGPDAFVRGSAAAALKDVVAAIERAHGRAGRKTAG